MEGLGRYEITWVLRQRQYAAQRRAVDARVATCRLLFEVLSIEQNMQLVLVEQSTRHSFYCRLK